MNSNTRGQKWPSYRVVFAANIAGPCGNGREELRGDYRRGPEKIGHSFPIPIAHTRMGNLRHFFQRWHCAFFIVQ